ncbi:PREDICTED: uncharacterized protein LOC109165429 [Ipomoea nil]|uniref:uncharacterized protein LOC109165429 n=1 Tax=Ipomoea nil TaxID=35883 RepID=UPI0009008D41|nr:PREDICTED: uncharacterized protein LOC109165429 [Ipomoea nil]
MGKSDDQRLPLHLQQLQNGSGEDGSAVFFCERCSMGLCRFFSFKCFFILLLSIAVFLSALFWVLPRHSNQSGFDANHSIKLGSSVQAYFELDKTVSDLIPYIARLEYDIFGEIGVPFTKVAILSVHQAGVSNQTNVTFGVLSNPIDTSITPASLSLLRSSLLDVFLQQVNLILTTSIFGRPSSFQILKFPGGVTLNPDPHSPFWQEQVLFQFTLNNSIGEIKEYFDEFKKQLRSGLHLQPYENVCVQVNSRKGSTVEPPVTVEASIVSDVGDLPQERLRELARIITGSSPAMNLGLNNSVFGKVKEVSLSSFLNHSLQASPPAPSPAPSPAPVQNDPEGPSISPSPSPAHLPDFGHLTPCCECPTSQPSDANHLYGQTAARQPDYSLSALPDTHAPHVPSTGPCGSRIPPNLSPTSHGLNTAPNYMSPLHTHPQHTSHVQKMPLAPSPLPILSHASNGDQDKGNRKGFMYSPQVPPSMSSSLS